MLAREDFTFIDPQINHDFTQTLLCWNIEKITFGFSFVILYLYTINFLHTIFYQNLASYSLI
jgi:hypothetical protein